MTQTQPLSTGTTEKAPGAPAWSQTAGLFGPTLGRPSRLNAGSVGRLRAWLIIRGLAGLALGALILFLPGLSIEAFALVIGIFFVVAGVIRIVIGAVDTEFTAGLRVLNIIMGVLLAAIGAIAIRYPGFGLVATVILVGFAWMMEGGATLALLPPSGQGRGWAIAFAVVSLVAGVILILWPLESLLPLVIVAGAALVVGGIFDLVGGITLKKTA
ncbi:MAG: DUF308 domain-containing protein [Bifidobacteriaceae bacterium]|jgi:uncharacterized membrane protein HdeD (DUF308 family)|nr:DUF308 domain-containing protein [Bifidobacteriaceae bacterium]